MKLNLGELIEKRDALRLCEHFELSEGVTSVMQSSGNPGLAVLESLEELQYFTASKISPVLKVVNDPALEEAVSVLKGCKKRSTLPELAVSLQISVGSKPPSSLTHDGPDFVQDLPTNRNHVFHKELELQTFFQEEFSVLFVSLLPGTIVLKTPKLEDLLKLQGQVYSRELARKLSPILLTNFNKDNLMTGDTGQLQAS
ncbi:hypothetical protein HOLleu_36128 [Holothuria leucospilota]|uniref:Uncharacterized protein n=1 Tax=Holothuria leucospilota TaxID=206669 RepID=A0A9Q0YJE4_HOLLE|nr:hypothetical protein HOLleu_36128 [Holothuria leucospilota]